MCDSTKKFFCMFAAAHVDRQTGGRRLLAGKFFGRLLSVTQRQSAVQIQLAGLFHLLDQFLAGEFAQRFAGLLRLAQVALEQAAVGLAHFGDRLAGHEVNDLVDFQGLVRFAPSQHRNVEHRNCLSSERLPAGKSGSLARVSRFD